MTIRLWDPFTSMEQMRREVDRVFEQFGNGSSPLSRVAFLPARSARTYPLVNLQEDTDNYYIEGLAPGLDPDSLEISVVRDSLRIEGEKAALKDEIRPEQYHRNERAAGRFVRTIQLPGEIDRDKVTAQYEDGLIRLTLPKAEVAKPKVVKLTTK